MKIAYFVNEFPALSQTFVLNQITGMINLGHEVDIYATRRFESKKCHPEIERYRLLEKTRFFCDVPSAYLERATKATRLILSRGLWRRPGLLGRAVVTRHGGKSRLNLRLLYRVLALVDRGRYDIIHCQFGTLGQLAVKLKRLGVTDAAIITSFRGYDITKVLATNPGFYDELFRAGAFFLPVCRSLADKLVQAGCPPDRIRILHSGIDSTKFTYVERTRQRGDTTRLLGVGRFVEKKGWPYAIEAVANALRSGRDVHFTLVGDGELKSQIESKIKEYRIQDHVTLTGWCSHDEITHLLDKSHILIAPSITARDSDQEGIPNVLKEAMASGLPVLSTRHSGIPELVEDAVTGYLVPERDANALSERLITLCDHPETWVEMGRKAREIIVARFDTATLNKNLLELYRAAKTP